MCEGPGKAESAALLDSKKITLPEEEISHVGLASPPTPGETNPVLTKHDNPNTPQGPCSPPTFASRPITRLKSQEVCYSPKELFSFLT